MLEIEMKRFEAMKRRQEKEIKRIVANERQMSELQRKLLKAENDDALRKKEHTKRVADLKAQAASVETPAPPSHEPQVTGASGGRGPELQTRVYQK